MAQPGQEDIPGNIMRGCHQMQGSARRERVLGEFTESTVLAGQGGRVRCLEILPQPETVMVKTSGGAGGIGWLFAETERQKPGACRSAFAEVILVLDEDRRQSRLARRSDRLGIDSETFPGAPGMLKHHPPKKEPPVRMQKAARRKFPYIQSGEGADVPLIQPGNHSV